MSLMFKDTEVGFCTNIYVWPLPYSGSSMLYVYPSMMKSISQLKAPLAPLGYVAAKNVSPPPPPDWMLSIVALKLYEVFYAGIVAPLASQASYAS